MSTVGRTAGLVVACILLAAPGAGVRRGRRVGAVDPMTALSPSPRQGAHAAGEVAARLTGASCKAASPARTRSGVALPLVLLLAVEAATVAAALVAAFPH